jgi:multicomponent K+:H+ antiporter subunit E
MKRWLPFPVLSLALLAMWLVLNQTLDAGHVLLGTALALGGGHVLAGLQQPEQRVRRRGRALAILFALVFIDIVRSNIAVARIVLQPGIRGRTSGFVSLPLELRHPGGLAALACIITATPGTSWASYDAARNLLTIHVLDLVDEEAWVSLFKERYERRLMEIFE